MSRVGLKPIVVPDGVSLKLEGRTLRVSGPKGELETPLPPGISFVAEDGSVRFERPVHEVAEGLKKQRTFDVVIHHYKYALRDEALIGERDRLYRDLVERGLAQGFRYRLGKDY